MHRLTQSSLDSLDFDHLQAAINAAVVVDATGLRFQADQLAAIRQLLNADPAGLDHFAHWRFERSEFAAGCDFSSCRFRISSFDDCTFGDHVSFAKAVFTRSLFRRTTFGDDITFERCDLGVRADFHSASFGHRPRFSHSLLRSTQFFAVRFGEEASFARTRFETSAHFHNARFGPRANFTEARFSGAVDFGGAYFGDKFQMMKARFATSPSFLGARFGPRARLTNWRVDGDLNLRSVHFLGPASLQGADVRGNLALQYAYFEDSIDLSGVHVTESAYLGDVVINGADRIGPLHIRQKLDLRGAIVRSACAFVFSAKNIDLSDTRFGAPARISVSGGDVVMDRVESEARLVVDASHVVPGELP